jgi:hypothetical protein
MPPPPHSPPFSPLSPPFSTRYWDDYHDDFTGQLNIMEPRYEPRVFNHAAARRRVLEALRVGKKAKVNDNIQFIQCSEIFTLRNEKFHTET